jgi:hypothetical protein
MTGPGGTSTKRDQRRDSRRAQFQQRQLERQRERQRRMRQQQLRRGGFAGAGVLVIILLALSLFVWHPWLSSGHPSTSSTSAFTHDTHSGQYTSGATGEVRDGMSCLPTEATVVHVHAYLAIFVNGQQVQVPPNTGIISSTCLYALHVHPGDDNIIHIESPSTAPYSLGNFFDIWGQPLSSTQMMSNTVDSSHPLKVVVVDGNGKSTTWTGNPWDIKLTAHETIFLLYNSPKVQPSAFTQWKPNE